MAETFLRILECILSEFKKQNFINMIFEYFCNEFLNENVENNLRFTARNTHCVHCQQNIKFLVIYTLNNQKQVVSKSCFKSRLAQNSFKVCLNKALLVLAPCVQTNETKMFEENIKK